MSQRDSIAPLAAMQYERNELEFKRGAFRVRGDVLDVFPAEHSETALRIALTDDEIDSLPLFDPLTGQAHQRVPRFTVYPSSHYVTPRSTTLRAIDAIKIELTGRGQHFPNAAKRLEANSAAHGARA